MDNLLKNDLLKNSSLKNDNLYNLFKIINEQTQELIYLGITTNTTRILKYLKSNILKEIAKTNEIIINIIATNLSYKQAKKQLHELLYALKPAFNPEIRGNVFALPINKYKLPEQDSNLAKRLVVCLNTGKIDTFYNICLKYQFDIVYYSINRLKIYRYFLNNS